MLKVCETFIGTSIIFKDNLTIWTSVVYFKRVHDFFGSMHIVSFGRLLLGNSGEVPIFK